MKSNKTADILIVDDRADGLMAIEAAVDLPNVNLVKAHSGMEALQFLDAYEFAVILLDVQMPGMDGFETAARIREDKRYAQTPILFVTAINKDDRYIYKGYDLGAVDYIFKPFDAHVLKSKVKSFVELYLKSVQLKEQAEQLRESERKERFQKLAELEIESLKRYRSLADSVPHMVWKARNDGIFDYFNQVWINYTGLSHEQSIGTGWQVAIHCDDLTEFLKVLIQAMNSGEQFETEGRFRQHDGEMRWHWVRATPEIRAGQVVSWIGTCTDIHAHKLAETKLIDAEKMATAANIAKTSFLANMSHEIRTPMNAILGFSELMLNPHQTEEERLHCVRTVHRCGRQLINIIDEILDISKIEAGRLEIEEIEFNLISLLQDLKAIMDVQAKGKDLNLKFDLKTEIPEFIFTDPTRIRQILVNVIGNAIKFTPQGGVTVEVSWLRFTDNDYKLQFKVQDTGIGIDPTQRDKLFKPFVQVDNSTTRKFGGTGLGLFLSRQLAQALRGNIILEKCEVNEGATFLVELKVKPLSQTRYVGELGRAELPVANPTYPKQSDALKGLKILLVEDSVDNQNLITYFLKKAGADVEIAQNGVEGVQKTLAGAYNLILMDIQMPQLDGYQATALLREKGYAGPIIALTAHALKEEREKCLKAGYNEHMTKPVDRNVLINRVAQFATTKHLQTH